VGKKILSQHFALMVAAFCSIALVAQTPTPSPPATMPLPKIDYSESVPFEPEVFVPAKDTKKNNNNPKAQKPDKEKRKADPDPFPTNKTANTDGLLTIPVSIFVSSGGILSGLSRGDIKVFIGDEEQTIVSMDVDKPLNLVLLLDVSPSTDGRIAEIKNIATHLVASLRPDDKIMVVDFAQNLKILTDFTTDREAIAKAIGGSKMDDGTAIYNAMSGLFRKKLSLLAGPSSIVVLSDGIDTVSTKANYLSSIVDAERGNTSIFPVFFDTVNDPARPKVTGNLPPGLSNLILGGIRVRQAVPTKEERAVGVLYLNQLTKLSGGRAIAFAPSSSNVTSISANLALWLKGQFFVTIKPSISVKSDGRLPVRVRVNRPNLTVLAKGSYFSGD